MSAPIATYRLQFHSKFTFDDAQKIVHYLAQLGISDIYASRSLNPRKTVFMAMMSLILLK